MIFNIDKYYLIDNSKYYIYRIISPTNKVYIGQTTSAKFRFKSYKNAQCKGQRLLYRSFIKHGVLNHRFEILETYNNDTDISILNDREIYNIKKHKDFGYKLLNLSEGGRNAKKSEETRKKISQSNIGKSAGKLNPMYGKTHSSETKLKISICNKNRKMKKEVREMLTKKVSKPIIQYTITGDYIKEWNSAVEVSKVFGYNSRVINSQARGLFKNAYGYIWKYKIV